LAALSFSGPLHQPRAGIPADTDEMFDVRHLLSHGASWRTFDFLGYTFRPRLSGGKLGGQFVNFLPAIGDDERKRIGRVIRSWRLHRWSDSALSDLATAINAEVQGWINFYGRFYRSELVRLLRRINEYLIRWARCKYKRLRRYPAKARRFLADVFRREPGLFAHWRFGARPDGWTMGAG
jgi:RNA-directed DNA polymerase